MRVISVLGQISKRWVLWSESVFGNSILETWMTSGGCGVLDVSIFAPVISWCFAAVDEFFEESLGGEGGVSAGVCLDGSVVSESWYLCVSRAHTIAAVLRIL